MFFRHRRCRFSLLHLILALLGIRAIRQCKCEPIEHEELRAKRDLFRAKRDLFRTKLSEAFAVWDEDETDAEEPKTEGEGPKPDGAAAAE